MTSIDDLRVNKQVFRLDISMDYVISMAESDSLDHLVDKLPQSFWLLQVKN